MEKTIAAVSTAFGKGGIAVIRISGEDAVGVADRMFRPASGKPVIEYESGRAVYGDIIKNRRRHLYDIPRAAFVYRRGHGGDKLPRRHSHNVEGS